MCNVDVPESNTTTIWSPLLGMDLRTRIKKTRV